MPNTYDLSTDIGKVRLAVGDFNIAAAGAGIRPGGANISDEELTFFIQQAGSWSAAVAPVLRSVAASYTVQAKRVALADGSAIEYADIAAALLRQADQWEANPGGLAPTSWADAFDSRQDAPAFFGTRQFGAEVKDQRTLA